jgi:hypothetical protein
MTVSKSKATDQQNNSTTHGGKGIPGYKSQNQILDNKAQTPPPVRHSGFVKNYSIANNSHLTKGQKVRICTMRPNREQFNGCEGTITTIVDKDIAYVRLGRLTPCFYLDELIAVVEV